MSKLDMSMKHEDIASVLVFLINELSPMITQLVQHSQPCPLTDGFADTMDVIGEQIQSLASQIKRSKDK
jgi:hypothetical protein